METKYPRVGLGIIIVNKDGDILIGKRKGRHAQKFSIPGGHLEMGETFEQGAIREIKEEKGVLRELTEESGLYDFLCVEKIDKVFAHYFNFNKKKNMVALATCFLVILKSTKLKSTNFDEHEEFELKWVNPKDLFSIWELHSEDKNYDHWIYFLTKSVNRAIELGYDTTSQKM